MTASEPVDAERRSFADRLRAHPRIAAVGATAVVVSVALAVALVVLVNGDEDEPPPPPPPEPLALAAPTDLSSVFSVSGGAGELSPEELAAVTDAIEGYLQAATVEPLEYDAAAAQQADGDGDGDGEEDSDDGDSDGGGGSPPPLPPTPLTEFFTEAAAPRLDGDDRLALSDAHLPFAEHGVSTDFARVTDLAALVGDDGAGLLVAATIDVRMRVRTGRIEVAAGEGSTTAEAAETDAVIVRRTGELVLQPVDGAWRIGGYEISVTRKFGTAVTTTSEAAFGARLP